MKCFRLLIALLLLLCGASGVMKAEEKDTRPMWGVKAGLDFNLPGKWHIGDSRVKMYRQGFGVNVGGLCNIYLGKDFYFEPGISLFYDVYSYYDLVILGDDGTNFSDYSNPYIYKVGFRIPLIFGRSIDFSERFSMSVFTGPELNYAFAGGIKGKNSKRLEETGVTLFGKGDGCQRRFDCAWKVGIGVPMNEWFLSLDAAFGLTDMLKGGGSFRENRVTLGVTRYF